MAVLPMARIALRNLLTRPATRRYPYVKRESFAAARGRIVIDFPACVLCGACSKHCPAGAIEVSKAEGRWDIDRMACVMCGACVRACPKKCLDMAPERLGAIDAASGGRPGPAARDAADEASGRFERRLRPPAPPAAPPGAPSSAGAADA